MEPRQEKRQETVHLRLTELEDRETPSVTVDVAGLVHVETQPNVHASVQATLVNIDVQVQL